MLFLNLRNSTLDDYDTVYFSHCYPYTYSQLNKQK